MAIRPVSFGAQPAAGMVGFAGQNANVGPTFEDTDFEKLRVQGQQAADQQKRELQARLQQAQIEQGGANYRTDVTAGTQRYGDALGAQTAQRGQDQNYALGNRQADVAQEGNKLQFQAQMAPIEYKRDVFDKIFPMVSGVLSGAGGPGQAVGGSPRPQPAVTPGGVYSDQQTQERVNAARAGIDQQAASQSRAAATKLAGQGFGGRSPLLAALQQQIQGQAMAAGADAERETRSGAAEANAKQRLAAEDLMQQQWRDYEDSDIRRRQAATNQTSALLSALTNLL